MNAFVCARKKLGTSSTHFLPYAHVYTPHLHYTGQSRKGALEKFAASQPSLPNMHSYMLGLNSANSSMSIQNNTSTHNMPTSTHNSVANLNSMNSMNMYSNSNISTSNLSQATPPRRGSNFRSFAASNASMRESTSFVAKMRTLNTSRMSLKEQNKSKNRRIRQQDTSLTAELRNVIVLFISVKLDSEQLLTTDKEGSKKDGSVNSEKYSGKYSEKASAHCYVHSGEFVHSRIKGFHFLSRTEEEFNDDQRIMNRYV